MAFKGLREFIQVLEGEKELLRVKEFVDPILEIAEPVSTICHTSILRLLKTYVLYII